MEVIKRHQTSHKMDKSPENPEEDTVSLRSNEETPSNGGVKLGMLQSLRTSIRRVAEKSPLSSGRKGSKVTTADESRLQVPPSPSEYLRSAVR